MRLSDLAIQSAKAADKPYKMTDGGGMYLLVSKAGGKLWRFDYRFGGKRKTMALGRYPEMTLGAARRERDEARKLVSAGYDPMAKGHGAVPTGKTFGEVADAQVQLLRDRGHSPTTIEKNEWLQRLAASLHMRPIGDIKTPEVMDVLRAIELSGRRETAMRLRSFISRVFSLAIINGDADTDPTYPLRKALAAPIVTHRAALTAPKQIGALLNDIYDYDGWPTIRAALLFTAFTFARPGSVRHAEWSHIDRQDRVWRIPKERMKRIKGRPAIPFDVPLSDEALAILDSVEPLTGKHRLIFSSIRSFERPISEAAMISALRRMGYRKEDHVPHGFRTTASTRLNEDRRFRKDVIEFQLAHVESNKVRGAYNRAQYWDERVVLMREWGKMLTSYRKLAS